LSNTAKIIQIFKSKLVNTVGYNKNVIFVVIKTKSIYEPVEEDDGVRVLITRYYPRGVKKDHFHVWFRSLSPSANLLKQYKNGTETWEEFEEAFVSEIRHNSESSKQLKDILKRSKHSNVTLLCYERTGHNCHRYIVKDLLNKQPSSISISYS
jgi:uncharacterized protein YeaO (DUF488 family)